jgi:hypothetical protein
MTTNKTITSTGGATSFLHELSMRHEKKYFKPGQLARAARSAGRNTLMFLRRGRFKAIAQAISPRNAVPAFNYNFLLGDFFWACRPLIEIAPRAFIR